MGKGLAVMSLTVHVLPSLDGVLTSYTYHTVYVSVRMYIRMYWRPLEKYASLS